MSESEHLEHRGEPQVDRSPGRVYLLGASVVLVFLGLNVWIALDHLHIPSLSSSQTVDGLKGTKLLAAQRSALLSSRPDNGPIDLQMMQKAGVNVPDSFVHGDIFASPWGRSLIMKQYNVLVWDFYEITTAGCTQLLGSSGAIAGVFSVAASSRSADEKPPPLTFDVAAQECRRTPLMARLLLK
jgi:hypothetical protein